MHLIEAVQKRQGERQRDRETGLYLRATVSRAMQMGLPLPEDVGADGGRRRGAEARGGGGPGCVHGLGVVADDGASVMALPAATALSLDRLGFVMSVGWRRQ
jgi:hypothetical protein